MPRRPSGPSADELAHAESRIPPELLAHDDAGQWIASCGWALWYAAVLLILVIAVGPVLGG